MKPPVLETLGPSGWGSYRVDWAGPEPVFERVEAAPEGYLIPGFVDLHIHGAFGIDWLAETSAAIGLLADRLEGEGYEGFLLTTVTLDALSVGEAIGRIPPHPAILGVHLEGPWISPKHPGAQPQDAIAVPADGLREWEPILDHPLLRVVTLAPEVPGAPDLALRLMKRGVVVSMGHSDATYEEARRGYEFGASQVTHMFNAMRPFHHREPGLVGYALLNRDVRAELIYDRVHVRREAADLLLRLKPDDGVVAVSDGTMASGMPRGTVFRMWGRECVVERDAVRLADSGGLAGSKITLRQAFARLAEDFGPEVATRLCCLNPRKALGLAGPPRVYVILDRDFQVRERRVRVAG